MSATGGDVERTQVSVSKGAVCRPIHRNLVRLEHAARRSKDVDHGAWSSLAPARAGDDVALRVQTHAIDTPLHPAGVPHSAGWARISLKVHSLLDGVGLTAAIASALGREGISANMVAAYFHDHIFVPWEQRHRAMAVLAALAAGGVLHE